MKTVTIYENDAGQRLDKFLQKYLKALPKSFLYKLIRKKRIKLNGKRAEGSSCLKTGDILTLYISDEFFQQDEAVQNLEASVCLNIVYEDENLLLVDKPSGISAHSGGKDTDSLVCMVQRYLYQTGKYHPDKEHSFAPALCNRIDKNTQGIVIAAKNAAALRILNEKIRNREITKKYLCVVNGILPTSVGTLRDTLSKNQQKNKVYETQRGKKAVSHYRLIDIKNNLSLVEVTLETGRTHQIRAQFAAIGHPLYGDVKYGAPHTKRKQDYQLLASYCVAFHFTSDAGPLSYLNGKTFEQRQIDFVKDFYAGLL